MRNLFLYRLFRYSIPGFLFVVLFIAGYAICFSKKMDMLFFPYNSMFSIDFTGKYTSSTYAIKINGERVKITGHPYWKKDFLEESLTNYGKYIQHGNLLFLDDYLKVKFPDSSRRTFFLERLVPNKTAAMEWPGWYCRFAGYPTMQNARMEIVKYDFLYKEGKALLTDSQNIYTSNRP